jgi:hypothetical protein
VLQISKLNFIYYKIIFNFSFAENPSGPSSPSGPAPRPPTSGGQYPSGPSK